MIFSDRKQSILKLLKLLKILTSKNTVMIRFVYLDLKGISCFKFVELMT